MSKELEYALKLSHWDERAEVPVSFGYTIADIEAACEKWVNDGDWVGCGEEEVDVDWEVHGKNGAKVESGYHVFWKA